MRVMKRNYLGQFIRKGKGKHFMTIKTTCAKVPLQRKQSAYEDWKKGRLHLRSWSSKKWGWWGRHRQDLTGHFRDFALPYTQWEATKNFKQGGDTIRLEFWKIILITVWKADPEMTIKNMGDKLIGNFSSPAKTRWYLGVGWDCRDGEKCVDVELFSHGIYWS